MVSPKLQHNDMRDTGPDNAKNSIQFEYNGEIAFDLAIENDPATISDSGISAKATIRTWPIEGGSGEEASVLLRHRGSEPTGS